jgi:hypothetical protein
MKAQIWTSYAASVARLYQRTITENFVFSDWGKAHIAKQCEDFTTIQKKLFNGWGKVLKYFTTTKNLTSL